MSVSILEGDCREVLAMLPAESVHCVVTSPPYWGLRDYGIAPSIWGGDPDCQHEWEDTISVNATNHTAKARWNHTRNGRDELQPVEKRVSWLRTEVKQGQFCRLCGAWAGAHGLEPTYELYIDHAVEIFRAVRRVLRPDGTLWLNLGDSYATGAGKVGNCPGGGEQGERWRGGPPSDKSTLRGNGHVGGGPKLHALDPVPANRGIHTPENSGKHGPRIEAMGPMTQPNRMPQPNLKPKDLCGVPWRVAFALQADGWWLRQDIIWSKPNPMPESVTDRCTKAHEYLFLLSKSERYYFDQEAIAEPCSPNTHARLAQDVQAQIGSERAHAGGKTNGNMKAVGRSSWKGSIFDGPRDLTVRPNTGRKRAEAGSGIKNNDSMDAALAIMPERRNRRSVWEVATQPFSEAHFATFPPALIEPCIKAGCPKGGTVLDPFGGAGTTGLVADRLQRNAILIELNPAYVEMARRRIDGDAPLFLQAST